jgi:hypothetical protein
MIEEGKLSRKGIGDGRRKKERRREKMRKTEGTRF